MAGGLVREVTTSALAALAAMVERHMSRLVNNVPPHAA